MEVFILWAVFMVVGWRIGKSRGVAEIGCALACLLGPIGWLITALLSGQAEVEG